MKLLKVRAVGAVRCPRFELPGARRFVGRTYDPETGTWPTDDALVEVPNTPEYRMAVRDGDLEAADSETAKECGVSAAPKPFTTPSTEVA